MGECIIADSCYARRDGDSRQARAAVEGIITNAHHPIRDGDVCQTSTAGECFIADFRHTIRDGDACQIGAVPECSFTNARHPIWDGNALQASAAGECAGGNHPCLRMNRTSCDILTNTRNQCDIRIISVANVFCIIILRVFQTGTAGECRPADSYHVCRDGDALQTTAAVERIIPDARHTIRDSDVRDAVAVGECIIPDGRHGITVRGDGGNDDFGIGAGADVAHTAGAVTVRGELQPLGGGVGLLVEQREDDGERGGEGGVEGGCDVLDGSHN